MVRLTTAGDSFEARVLAARLGSEGIVWELRGAVDGPLTFGVVDVLVSADDLALARELLLGDEVEHALAPADALPERETTLRDVAMIAAVLVVMLLFAIARMFFVG